MNREHRRLVERLESGAEDLSFYLRTLSAEGMFEKPEAGEWSIHEIAAHLRDTEERVFLARVKRILSEDHPAVEDFDQDAWHEEHYSATEPVASIISEFMAARKRQLRLLRDAKDRDWARTGRHPEYGVISIDWVVSHDVNHTLEHVSQLGYAYEKRLLEKLQGQGSA